MKLKVYKKFFDLKAGIMREAGDVFDADEARAGALLDDSRGLVKKHETATRRKRSK